MTRAHMTAAAPQGKASVFGRMAAEAQGKAVFLSLTFSQAEIVAGPHLAIGETVILLHPPLPSAGVSIQMQKGRQQNDSLADGYSKPSALSLGSACRTPSTPALPRRACARPDPSSWRAARTHMVAASVAPPRSVSDNTACGLLLACQSGSSWPAAAPPTSSNRWSHPRSPAGRSPPRP